MNTYLTGNPLGSTAVKDLYDNASNIDDFVNGPAFAYPDRFNVARKSWAGMEDDFQQFLLNSGYTGTGPGGAFEDYDADGPLTITARNQIFTRAGEFYRADAALALPYVTLNNWAADQTNFVSVGDAVLRQDLASTDLAEGATLVARAIRHIDSVAELNTLPGRYDGDTVYLVGYYAGAPGVGEGLLRWDAGSTATVDGGTAFDAGLPSGRWLRPVGRAIFMDWFGFLGDGVTTEDAKVRAMIAACPDGGVIFGSTREMTVLLDSPAGQGRWPAAAVFNKPGMKFLGNHACLFKLKDFSASYVTYGTTVALAVFRVSASDVELSGLNIDANADHHYETDINGDKWFEGEGPTGKRPANGIGVTLDIGQANITGVRIRNCKIFRPLAGIYVAGNLSLGGGSLDEPTFFTKSLATDTVVDCVLEGNDTSFCRGNDYLFIAGVRDSVMRGNTSRNSMYHNYRFYAGVESCTMEDNRAYMNYAEIAARWNPTDLGYWRTDNPALVGYKIERAGYAIGSSSAQTSANSGNVRRCSMVNNYIWYNSNTETGSGIVDTLQTTLGSFFAWQVVNGILISGNESRNSPFQGLVFINSILALNPTAQGVVFDSNRIDNCGKEFIYTLGTGPVFTRNAGTNCGIDASGFPIVYCQGGARIYQNSLIWQRTTANANTLFNFVAYGTAGLAFISDNTSLGYTGLRMNKLSTDIVHGTDGGGVPLTLLAGWAAGTETALIIIDCAGNATLVGRIQTAAGGTNAVASLNDTLVMYRPRTTVRWAAFTSALGVVEGSVTAAGTINLDKASGPLADGVQVSLNAHWKVDMRI